MTITVHNTDKIVTLNGVPARLWEGETSTGVKMHCFITRIACEMDADASAFEKELLTQAPPSAARCLYSITSNPLTMDHPLTIEELRQFWKFYKAGVKKSVLCKQMKLSEEYCEECLAAAQLLFGRKPRIIEESDEAPAEACHPGQACTELVESFEACHPEPVEGRTKPNFLSVAAHRRMFAAAPVPPLVAARPLEYKNGKLVRPPAEYSNCSPMGIAKPGNHLSVTCTSVNEFKF